MNKLNIAQEKTLLDQLNYDLSFFDDMHELFLGLKSGHLGKYIYNKPRTKKQNDIWNELSKQQNNFYMYRAERELLQKAREELSLFLPSNIGHVEFGIGSVISLITKTIPLLIGTDASNYTAIDFCHYFLKNVDDLSEIFERIDVRTETILMDFFLDKANQVTKTPSLGTILGGTICNMYNSPASRNPEKPLIKNLKRLSKISSHGWILISIDTNQSGETLKKMYSSKMHAIGHLTPIQRMATELPTTGFNPHLFKNDPQWIPETHLLAQTITATRDQDFMLGEHPIMVHKGQKLHVMNSYKFTQDFFEDCCDKANLDIVNLWEHETPVKLYLLMDRKNPYRT